MTNCPSKRPSPAPDRRLRLAVVGAGHLGRIHARLLAEQADVELAAVVDPLAAAREPLAAALNTAPLADHRELLGRIDGVIVAAPTVYHRQVAADFLRAGVAVLVEKPMTSTLSEADDLLALARAHDAILQVGHVERFNPALGASLPHLQSPRFIDATRTAGFTFRSTDVGVVLDLMIHDLDLALALAASEVVRVDAIGWPVVTRHEDVAYAWLEFASGCLAQLTASRISPTPARRLVAWTSAGCTTVDLGARTASRQTPSEALVNGELAVDELTAEQRDAWKDRFTAEHLPVCAIDVADRNALVDEQRDFAAAIRTGAAPRVDGRQGRAVLAVALQIVAAIERRTERWPASRSASEPTILRPPRWRAAPTPAAQQPPRREAG